MRECKEKGDGGEKKSGELSDSTHAIGEMVERAGGRNNGCDVFVVVRVAGDDRLLGGGDAAGVSWWWW